MPIGASPGAAKLAITDETTTLHVRPVFSIRKLRSIANTLIKTTPSNQPHSCQKRGILPSEDLMQKVQCTKAGQKRARQSQAVSWAIVYYVPNADKLRRSAAEAALQLRSVTASIPRILSGKERSYSLRGLLLELPQRAEPPHEAFRKPAVKRRHSYKCVVMANTRPEWRRADNAGRANSGRARRPLQALRWAAYFHDCLLSFLFLRVRTFAKVAWLTETAQIRGIKRAALSLGHNVVDVDFQAGRG